MSAFGSRDVNVRSGHTALRVVTYRRVSTGGQAESGAGLDAQRSAMADETSRRRWELVGEFEDAGVSGSRVDSRPGLLRALEAVESGAADVLMVSKLDRLSRSMADFANLMERSRRRGWTLVALDLGLDTSTPAGEMMANILATFAQFERRLIGQRTRDALQVKREQGMRLGGPLLVPSDVVDRMVELRAAGETYRAIAAVLERDRIPAGRGGAVWHANSVRRILLSRSSLNGPSRDVADDLRHR